LYAPGAKVVFETLARFGRARGIGQTAGMGIGAVLIIIGIIVWLAFDSAILGIILIILGLLFGGFRRGRWY
jgi:hypothetical protein